MAGDPKKPYGDNANYADPGYQSDGVHRYPLDTAEHVKAAWSYINKESNSSQYSSEQLAHIKSKIKAAAKKFGIDIAEKNSYTPDTMEKETVMGVERRYTPGLLRLVSESNEEERNSIGGYAAVFNKLSRSLGGFVEELNPGVFTRASNDGWSGVICRYNHDDNILLGTTKSGTLQLGVDDYGLTYKVQPPASRSDIVELVERGDIDKSSFAFRTVEDDWTMTDQGYPKRSLLSVELVDVAPVVTPAYVDTSVGLRSLAHKMDAPLDDIQALAKQDELRKLFIRTDRDPGAPAPKLTSGPAARARILARERDPYDKD